MKNIHSGKDYSFIKRLLHYYNWSWRILLRYIYNFDRWHVSTLYERKYARDIITYLNAKPKEERNSIVEIGCGLGDVIRNLNYTTKTGFDADINVLKAAKFLSLISSDKAIKFHEFKFPDSALSLRCDVIMLVNWIHHIPPVTLKNKLEEYFINNLRDKGEIIIDTVQDNEYKFNHSIKFLTSEMKCSVIKIGVYEREREVFAIKKV